MTAHNITADWDELMRQASMTADDYVRKARSNLIEQGFPDPSAADCIAMAQVAATDFLAAAVNVAGQRISEAIVEPDLGDVAHQLGRIADVIEAQE